MLELLTKVCLLPNFLPQFYDETSIAVKLHSMSEIHRNILSLKLRMLWLLYQYFFSLHFETRRLRIFLLLERGSWMILVYGRVLLHLDIMRAVLNFLLCFMTFD